MRYQVQMSTDRATALSITFFHQCADTTAADQAASDNPPGHREHNTLAISLCWMSNVSRKMSWVYNQSLNEVTTVVIAVVCSHAG